MKVLKTERTNCGWFISYEHFDCISLLAFISIMLLPVYAIITGIQNRGNHPTVSWALIVMGTVLLLPILLGFVMVWKDHKFWFATKEKLPGVPVAERLPKLAARMSWAPKW